MHFCGSAMGKRTLPGVLIGLGGWEERLSKAAGDTGIFFGDDGLFIWNRTKQIQLHYCKSMCQHKWNLFPPWSGAILFISIRFVANERKQTIQ